MNNKVLHIDNGVCISFNLYIRDCFFALTKRKLIIFYCLKFTFGRHLFDYFYFFHLVTYNHEPSQRYSRSTCKKQPIRLSNNYLD